ncbi:hypothetical protein [Inediibacterium massiliense]|uniref:hypothetical protein n=1 Tax=Inediibacterium massiliense TaxID=1658111 RepID=UPI0018FECE23|nr:hypothetical protein [Inediibacterium massiliense]
MDFVINSIFLGLALFVKLLIIMYIMRRYMDIANVIGGKIISYFRYVLGKIKMN